MNSLPRQTVEPGIAPGSPNPARDGDQFAALRDEVNRQLDGIIPAASGHPTNLPEVMRYSLVGGGKRARAILSILVSEAADGQGREFALHAGCAIELIHAASLILDDLPCMDDATTRRGRRTTHVEYGMASTILASIGLLNRAFEIVASFADIDDATKSATIRCLTQAVGTDGMISGQDIDLHKRKTFSDSSTIESLNWLKTGVLFSAAAEVGAIAAQLTAHQTESVKAFSRHVGLAFQTADDLLDQNATVQIAGKDVNQDDQVPTLISLVGVDGAKSTCHEHLQLARTALSESGLREQALLGFVDDLFADHLGETGKQS